MADSTGDATGTHAEGIQHVAGNTATPAGAESGGVSSEKFTSPLYPGGSSTGTSTGTGSNLEQTSSRGGGVVETVKSYLGYGSGTGTNAAETGQLGTTGDTKNVEDNTTGTGSGAGVSGAAASAASAVGLGSGNSAAGGGLGSTSSSSGTADDRTGSSSAGTRTGGSTLETAKEKVQEATNTSGKSDDKPVTSGDDDHKPPQPAGGKPHKLENESSIPTAGGERLGEKHWGESKIVPDNPEKRASEAGVASEAGGAGQPTKQTSDNTAKNTGGATGPPGSSNTDTSGSGSGTGEEKMKMTDKIKDKLHMGKKE